MSRPRGICAAFAILFALLPEAKAYIFLRAYCIPERVATAELIVFGKIKSQEVKRARVPLYPEPNAKKHLYDVVFYELTVTEVIKGKLNAKTIRVALLDHIQSPKVEVGNEGCFALSKHYEQDFYVIGTGMFFNKISKEYEKETALVRRCALLRNDPDKGLTSKDQEDRYLTAYLVLYESCWGPKRHLTQELVEEPIDPKQSKLILKALAEADWTPRPNEDRSLSIRIPHPAETIRNVLVDSDSKKAWPKMSFFDDAYEPTFRAWFKDHADTARLQRLVPLKAPAKD